MFLAGFVGEVDGDCHWIWECQFPPLVRIRRDPEFAAFMACDRSSWHRCPFWHGCLPMLTPRGVQPPGAVAIADSVDILEAPGTVDGTRRISLMWLATCLVGLIRSRGLAQGHAVLWRVSRTMDNVFVFLICDCAERLFDLVI